MAWAPLERSAAQSAALDRCRALSAPGVAFLDLDGCLIDNRPRQVGILRRYAARHGTDELYKVRVEHFQSWTLSVTLRSAGVQAFDGYYDDLMRFWTDAFFSSEDLYLDEAMPGAVRFVRDLQGRGLKVVYLTARDHTVHDGTWESLGRFGFPLDGALLHTLDDLSREFHSYKRQAALSLAHLGPPALFMDNEPSIVNTYRETFPDALTIFVDTDRSPRPDQPHPELPVIRGFLG